MAGWSEVFAFGDSLMMMDHFSDDEVEELLSGTGDPSPLGAALDSIRHHYASIPAADPGPELSEFVSLDLVESFSTPASVTDVVVDLSDASRQRRRLPIAAVAGTVVGKLVIGVSVAAASIGGFHAGGLVDVPLLPEISTDRDDAATSTDIADQLFDKGEFLAFLKVLRRHIE